CLSSRLPHGEPVTPEKLRMIEAAENFLRDLGFRDVRVRHHEASAKCEVPSAKDERRSEKLSGSGTAHELRPSDFSLRTSTSLARIEVGVEQIPRLLQNDLFLRVAEALRKIGYAH